MGALMVACQRLEVVSDDDGTPPADWDDDGDDGDQATTDEPEEVTYVCLLEAACECYGRDEAQYCEIGKHSRDCGVPAGCTGPEDAAWAQCLVERHCEAGGHVEDRTVVCDGEPDDCAGACDLDPTLCDPDGDGVSTFACGPDGLECAFGRYCVHTSHLLGCGNDCEDCNPSGGEWRCADVPADCTDYDAETQLVCIEREQCEIPGSFNGREIYCGNEDECIV